MAFIVPREVVKKVEQYVVHKKYAEAIYAELQDYFHEQMDDAYMEDFFVVNYHSGQEQNDGEYCDQTSGYSGDDFSGTYFYPTKDGRYVAITYHC